VAEPVQRKRNRLLPAGERRQAGVDDQRRIQPRQRCGRAAMPCHGRIRTA
jgi:hypothetical protein